MSEWFGKGCEHQSCQWEDDERTGGPDYKECTPALIFCGHDGNPEDTEGNCRENICPRKPKGLEEIPVDKSVPWFVRILFPDVVVPVLTVAFVIALVLWAYLKGRP